MAAWDHMNGDTLAAMDIRTSGIDPCHSEVLQLAIVPLVELIPVGEQVFNCYMKPSAPVPGGAQGANKTAMPFINNGISQPEMLDLFQKWKASLSGKRLVPITYDPIWTRNFLVLNYGAEWVDLHFNFSDARSVRGAVRLLQDRESVQVPFGGYELNSITLNAIWTWSQTPPVSYGDGLSHALAHLGVWRALTGQSGNMLSMSMSIVAANAKACKDTLAGFKVVNPQRLMFEGDRRELQDILSNAQPAG